MTVPATGGSRPVFVAGKGLASTLGPNLAAALDSLATSGLPAPQLRELVPGESRPHLPLAAPPAGASWHESARRLIEQVVGESGATAEPGAPLFIASSSINIGALELGEDTGADCLVFSDRVAAWLGWSGPVFWINTACTSAINALSSAQRLIAAGEADSALVLGLEIDNRFSAAGFAGMQLLSPDASRPLAAGRNGLVLGEAVAAIWLRSGECDAASGGGTAAACKKNRPTPLRWCLRGGANVVDGRDPAGAAPSAVLAMADQALRSAGLRADQIDLIKLQAAGSPHNDAAEIAGLGEVFGQQLPALCSLKPLLGHTLGAAGAAELALLLACLEAGVWPPQCRAAADPALNARLAETLPTRLRYFLFVILGFGGGHAALLLEDRWAGLA